MRTLIQIFGFGLFGMGLAMMGYDYKTLQFWFVSIGLILWIEVKEDR